MSETDLRVPVADLLTLRVCCMRCGVVFQFRAETTDERDAVQAGGRCPLCRGRFYGPVAGSPVTFVRFDRDRDAM